MSYILINWYWWWCWLNKTLSGASYRHFSFNLDKSQAAAKSSCFILSIFHFFLNQHYGKILFVYLFILKSEVRNSASCRAPWGGRTLVPLIRTCDSADKAEMVWSIRTSSASYPSSWIGTGTCPRSGCLLQSSLIFCGM